jgi:hypothetical protein
MIGRRKSHVFWAGLLAGLLVAGATATEQPPLTQDVVYKIHDDPSDPNSPVTFTIWLSLTEAAADGDSIGWAIDKVRFHEVGQGGNPDRFWSVSDPDVPTADGLWWVDHADCGNPQLAEFDQPPHLSGVAIASESGYADLEYDFEGALPGSGPWEPTAWLDFEFALAGEPTPLKSSDDEPVEIDEDDPDTPAGGG